MVVPAVSAPVVAERLPVEATGVEDDPSGLLDGDAVGLQSRAHLLEPLAESICVNVGGDLSSRS